MARSLLSLCGSKGLDVLIYCTWRSGSEQLDLYAQGRTKPGRIVTWAKPGESLHNLMVDGRPASRAFDCCPMVGGRPVWDESSGLWVALGLAGESVGLEWAGRWPGNKREFPHFQQKG